MPGVEDPDTPPEVPEEYEAVYRDAYERALTEEPDLATELLGDDLVPAFPDADRPRPRWLVPVGAAVAALVLIGAAYGLGRLLSSDDEPTGEPTVSAPAPTTKAPSRRATARQEPSTPTSATSEPTGDAYEGDVAPVLVSGVRAGCTSEPGVDSAGDPVRYAATNTVDGDASTAWRCDGRAIGEVLTLTLPAGTEVAEVGLIPGYAKTDEKSGADRYAENNRITRVRWTFSDGTSVEQRLDASPGNRDLQLLRVPETTSDSVTLEILGVRRGPRNTTAISEIAVAAATG